MNLDTWNSMPKDVQKVLVELAVDHSLWAGTEFHRTSVEGGKYAVEVEGAELITLSSEEMARWMEHFKPLVDKYLADTAAKGLPGKETLDELYRLKGKYEGIYK